MESYEAARAVFSRVQSIDPENASRIMGYILLHHGEKDMIRFAYGPETLIISTVNRAKTRLDISSNTSSASSMVTASNPIPIARPNPLSLPPRLLNHGFNFNPSSPSSPSVWSPHHHSASSHSLSYAAVLNNGTCNSNNTTNLTIDGSFSCGSSEIGPIDNFIDDFHPFTDPLAKSLDLYEQSVDLAMSPGCRSDSMLYQYWENSNHCENHPHFHRRSASFNDMYYGADDSTSGFGSKPCLYHARGFCKNGSACNFVHGVGGFVDSCDNNPAAIVGSPSKFDAFEQQCQEEIIRSKIAQQQRIAAQLMSGGMSLPYNKLNFLQFEAQRSAAAALLMDEEFHKLNGVRMARHEFSGMDLNPVSRQIYLTFPADSTFREEDVSNYFNIYGPVHDVRIPYQQKRMFGFVTFVYPETVKIILAKGNPHFVCDSRVLVKPYKEKSKLSDRKQLQQTLEGGEFSQCFSPPGHECRDPYDTRLGGRMLYSAKEMFRKKLGEDDLQQSLDYQGERLMNLQLLDLKNYQNQQNASVGSPVLSPSLAQSQSLLMLSNGFAQDIFEGYNGVAAEGFNGALSNLNDNVQNSEDDKPNTEESELFERGLELEHILPENLFASPKKTATEQRSSLFLPEFDNGTVMAMPNSSTTSSSEMLISTSSPLSLAPHKSCFFESPRLSTDQGAVGL